MPEKSLLSFFAPAAPPNPIQPCNDKLPLYVDMFNTKKTINITITYNPSWSDLDTIYEAPKFLKTMLDKSYNTNKNFKMYYFVNEKHKKSKRYHCHGQLVIKSKRDRLEEISIFKDLFHSLNKVFGRTTMKWNNDEVSEGDESDYPTYTHYCFKESEDVVIQCICGPDRYYGHNCVKVFTLKDKNDVPLWSRQILQTS